MSPRLLVIAVLVVGSVPALAERVPFRGAVPGPSGGCETDGYDAYHSTDGGMIPACDPAGITFGPLVPVPHPDPIADVILELDVTHTWVGDLGVALVYDLECDGVADEAAWAMCRIGLAGCDPEGCCGCGANLDGTYRFTDDPGAVSMETHFQVDGSRLEASRASLHDVAAAIEQAAKPPAA